MSGPTVRPSLVPTSDEKAAMAAAASPTGLNPFATMADVPAEITDVQSIGGEYLHGIETHGALSFDDTEHILTVAGEVAYWYAGTRYYSATALSCDIDDFETLTANTLYYFYFSDAAGTFICSDSPWSIDLTTVPVATVYWNGSTGAICEETHGYRRDLDWHRNAHVTIGARISASDFAITAPSVASPSTVNFAGGTLWDEDHASAFTNNTPAGMLRNCRVWYEVSAGKYTFVNRDTAYPSVGAAFVDSDATPAYTLTAITGGQHANVWLYVSPDIDRPIYAFLETRTAAHATLAAARAINPPNLSGLGLTPELKLLYRVIFAADESVAETTDYRSSASLPAGGTTAPTAAAVTFAPSGNIGATSVQTAIEELDSEKSGTGHTHTVTDRIVAVFDGGGSEIADAKKVYVYVPFACTITAWTILADQSGAIKVDVWKQAYADHPPEDANTITNGHEPEIAASADQAQDVDLGDWTTASVSAGDVLCFNVDSCTTIQWATVVLTTTRTV